MSQNVILSNDQAGVRTLTLNRPDKLNAANNELLLTLTQEIQNAGEDQAVRVLVITGAGRGFCAGQDLSEVAGENGKVDFTTHLHQTYNPLIRSIRNIPKPVITAVNGVAAGAGASIALAGDLRLWAKSALFVEVFSNIALIPDSGSTWFLPRMIGYHRAFRLMAMADKIKAEEGLELGLCEEIFPDENFAHDVQAYAEQLAARPAHALALTKEALNASLHSSLDESLDLEALLQQKAGSHWEYAEGVKAFHEKRAPHFIKPS